MWGEGAICEIRRQKGASLGIFFQDNDGWLDDQKVILHNKRRDVYMNKKEAIIKGGYFVEVSGSDKKKILWEVVDDHVVEGGNNHDEIGLQGFDFHCFG